MCLKIFKYLKSYNHLRIAHKLPPAHGAHSREKVVKSPIFLILFFVTISRSESQMQCALAVEPNNTRQERESRTAKTHHLRRNKSESKRAKKGAQVKRTRQQTKIKIESKRSERRYTKHATGKLLI